MRFKCQCGREYEVGVKQTVTEVSERQEQLALAAEFDDGVPLRRIVECYHEHLPMLPRVKTVTDARRRAIMARWSESKDRQTPSWWERYFRYVARKCPFLTGTNARGWRADFDFLLKKTNMQKVTEGYYSGRRDAAQ